MDKIDKQLLNIIQPNFPIVERPFQALAKELSLTEEEVIFRLNKLKKEKIIRRVGAVFNSQSLGYVSTLLAMKVPPRQVKNIANLINGYSGVTHNYLRNYDYNLWFTLTAPSEKKLKSIIEEIKTKTGISDLLYLPATRIFKIGVKFDLGEPTSQLAMPTGRQAGRESEVKKLEPETQKHEFSVKEISLIKQIQEDMLLCIQPFKIIANEIGMKENEVIDKLKEWEKKGIIRRFGAILRHKKAGFKFNAMGAWIVPKEKTDEVGRIMASFKEVSHCYERPTYPKWPYNLFTMIHGRSRRECEDAAKEISKATGIDDYELLYSTKEFKKVSMKYFAEEINA
ncbi:AsnC family transcriptional regulator [Candidatus Oleimmundimicrobium sp.]|uniref:siroheme decarboxylase subunit beta n=1 Tax=Candidatus Oleimmundimicrobium sp. TaxID=3060597 RepID=UPI002722E300|nr:AsnC family transcriptional regulator [Candidatus Oleimmundimicrobium sp.]MDO8886469.1 AsnC family transcriptional regulator [Candidatus Oleimmundimicrobium sp.]